MDRRHLSIERASPPGHLADRRSGVGYGSAGSKAPAPASFARASRENVRTVASLARRCRSFVLASLLEQARQTHFGDFALAGPPRAFYGEDECHQFFVAESFSRSPAALLQFLRFPWPRAPKMRTTMTCPRCSITSFSAATISIAASKWSKRLPVSAPPPAESIPAAAPATLFFRSASAAIWKSSLPIPRKAKSSTTPNSAP